MILIKGGRLLDPATVTDAQRDLVLKDGRIKAIGHFEAADGYARVIDAQGLVVAPGLVDVHVHFRDPDLTHKDNIASGAAAAARGGFTTVVCMANTRPPVDNTETLQMVLDSAAKAPIHVKTVAAVSMGLGGKQLVDMPVLKAQGAVGFSDDGIPLLNSAFARAAMRAVAALDVPISLHEEDSALIGTPGVNDGPAATALGLVGAPAVAEAALVARDCQLALDTGAKVHIQHLSCAAAVAQVRLAKQLGARVTAEVSPHHFALTEAAVAEYGTLAKMNPPLRTEADRQALIAALQDGTIDMIATDHAPHSREEKARPFEKAPSGIIGLETALALGITHLVRPGHLDLMALIEKMTLAPAALYGFGCGALAEGAPADLVLFDEGAQWTVDGFASKSANSPFTGQALYGKVKYTFCGGSIVYSDTAAT